MKQFNAAIDLQEYRDTHIDPTTLYARASLNRSVAKEVKSLMGSLLKNKNEIVNLDVSELDNLDLWAASQLVKTIRRIKARGQQFNIWCDNLKVRHLLELLRIDELVPVLNTDKQTIAIESIAA